MSLTKSCQSVDVCLCNPSLVYLFAFLLSMYRIQKINKMTTTKPITTILYLDPSGDKSRRILKCSITVGNTRRRSLRLMPSCSFDNDSTPISSVGCYCCCSCSGRNPSSSADILLWSLPVMLYLIWVAVALGLIELFAVEMLLMPAVVLSYVPASVFASIEDAPILKTIKKNTQFRPTNQRPSYDLQYYSYPF